MLLLLIRLLRLTPALLFMVLGLLGCSSNPANPSLTTLSNKNDFSTAVAQRIALLVPLQGPLAGVGQSVKQGFLAAAQEAGAAQQIIVINTSTGPSIQSAYTQASAKKVQFIVGPLLKPQVQSLASLQPSMPVLTLNYLNSDISTPIGLYQFGLSPLDEVQQATQLAWRKGYRSALIITEHGSWGAQIGEAFALQWQTLGGKVVDQIAVSQNSAATTQQMSRFLHFQAPHERRTDFDVIFLASSPQIGRQVKPLLKFFYAGDIAVFATAAIYSGIPQSQRLDSDLNQIIFCAAPWSLASNNTETSLYQQLKAASPEYFQRNSQYYALGIDAFHVTQQLARLNQSPQQTLEGASGLLSLNKQRRIVRQLPCAQFRHRGIVLIDQ
ncbi:MAG: hypothetical protein RLZZ225_942 [Pseudomonadota bacterium]